MTPTPVPDAAEVQRLVAVLDALPALVKAHRRAAGLSVREVAEAVRVRTDGHSRPVGVATVQRCEAGMTLSVPVLRAFLVWLGGGA